MKSDLPHSSYFIFSISVLIISVFSITLNAQNLSDSIYHDLDELVAEGPSLISINSYQLKIKERYSDLKSDQDRMALLIMHCNLGYYLKGFGKHYDAIDHYRKAWNLYNNYSLANYDIIEYCLKPLGNLLTITGNFADAENIIKLYKEMAQEQENSEAYTSGVINLSVVYHNIGNYHEALELLESHLEKGNIKEVQRVLIENNITTNLVALKKHEEAKITLANQKVRTVAALKNEAQLLIESQKFEDARLVLDKIELQLIEKESPRELAKFYVEKSQFHYLVEEKDSAIFALDNATKILLPKVRMKEIFKNKSILYAENTLIEIFDAYATYTDDWDMKLGFYDLSFYVGNLIFNNITDPQSKLIYQTSNRSRSEKCLQILFEEYKDSLEDELVWKAIRYAEKNKARVLKTSTHQKSLLAQHPDDSLLLFQQDLIKQHQTLVGELIRSQLANTDENSESKINQQFIKLSSQISKTQNSIDKKYSQASLEEEVNFKLLQKQLQSDDAQILYFFFGDRSLYLFMIDSDGISWKKKRIDEAFKDDLVAFIHLFESPTMINDDIVNFVNTSFRFSKLLGGDIKGEFTNLVIIPDGLLSFLPFEALINEDVNHGNFAKMPFWLKNWTISYNTSLSFYQQNQEKIRLENLYGVFPIFKNSSRYLKNSEIEAQMIKDKFEGKIDLHDHATKSNFLKNSRQFDVLHLSTHAFGGSFSVPAYIEFIDDVLFLPEIYAHNIDANLVVLSACETGVGKVIKGSTPMSLARGFQFAGTENIILTQWRVNDYSTAKIMENFYRELQISSSPSNSMQKARISYLMDQSISNIEKSPYYWAGFNYYGKTQVESRRSQVWIYSIYVACFILLLLLSLYIFIRFNKKN